MTKRIPSREKKLQPNQRLGRQLLIDLYDCPAVLLDDEEFISASMISAARKAGAVVVNSNFHRFSPCGVSGVVAIRESHLAIHTWPEYGYAAIDLFTCGDNVDPWLAHASLKEALSAGHDSVLEVSRPGPEEKSNKKTE